MSAEVARTRFSFKALRSEELSSMSKMRPGLLSVMAAVSWTKFIEPVDCRIVTCLISRLVGSTGSLKVRMSWSVLKLRV